MAWPTQQTSTVNLDQPGDSVAASRPEIDQQITNTNAIIDTFNITSPQDNDVLQANGTTEFINGGSQRIQPKTAVFYNGGLVDDESGDSTGLQYFRFEKLFDPFDLVTVHGFDSTGDSTNLNRLTITQSGTYSFFTAGSIGSQISGEPNANITLVLEDVNGNTIAFDNKVASQTLGEFSNSRELSVNHRIFDQSITSETRVFVKIQGTDDSEVNPGANTSFNLYVVRTA